MRATLRELENHKDGTMLAGRVGFRLSMAGAQLYEAE